MAVTSKPDLSTGVDNTDHDRHAAPTGAASSYPVRITPHIEALIARHGADSAIGRQYLPDPREMSTAIDENADPTGDHPHTPVAGIVHRHPDRVLLKPLHACAVYCRFCFRREMVGPGKDVLDADGLDRAFAYIENNPQIWEVILTGGDPLLLSPRRLAALCARLDAIPHIQVIRIHSRVPIADPDRVDDAMAAALSSAKPLYIVLHVNHPDEITTEVTQACARLRRADCTLLSQSVLLRGVNDDVDILEKLFRLLVTMRIKPYYLHHPDRAPGTAHFRLPFAVGQDLMNRLRGRLSGLALPAYVLDIPGGYGKVPVGPSYMKTDDHGHIHICDTDGIWYAYPSADGR